MENSLIARLPRIANAKDFADLGRRELLTSLRYQRGRHQESREPTFIA
jgi:hypothetical protein